MTTAPRLSIDLGALKRNWLKLSEFSGRAQTAAVVKADGYGLGTEQVVSALTEAGCTIFFTAMVEEGIRVRHTAPDATVYILNGIVGASISHMRAERLRPVLSNLDQIALWVANGDGAPCAVHVDTGMNRLGLTPSDGKALARNKSLLDRLNLQLLMTHPACADDPGHTLNATQLERFIAVASLFPDVDKSYANSAATLTGGDFLFDLTRPGIALYGCEALNDVSNPMETVVTAQARILQVRDCEPGDTVGYGATHTFDRPSRIAIVSGGYADGYMRAGSGSGVPLRGQAEAGAKGWMKGHGVPIVGRISMDLTAFDVTDVPPHLTEKAEWIELFGKNMPMDDVARACGTIGYELLTSLGSRYIRTYTR